MPPLNDEARNAVLRALKTNALLGRVAQLEADLKLIAETIQKYVPTPAPEPVLTVAEPVEPNP